MIKKIKIAFVVAGVVCAILAVLSLIGFIRGHRPSTIDVRVLLASEVKEVSIATKSSFVVYDDSKGEVFLKGVKPLKEIRVMPAKKTLKFGDRIISSRRIRVTPRRKQGVSLNGVFYRGEITITNKNGSLWCINKIGIEEYLKGVLPKEMYSYWPVAVLKAQAIASRSFAAYRTFRRRKKDYDLRHDATSQVYGGMDCETLRTTRAVHATNGKVLSYKEKIFPAYFNACCGGYRESSNILWGENLEPLEGGKCIWCRFSPVFKWREKIDNISLVKKMNKKGYDISGIDRIKLLKYDVSGRPEDVEMISGKKKVTVKTEDFRRAVGQDTLKSSKLSVRKKRGYYLFQGRGWGHGVGMCQWGAFGMAMFLRSTGNILKTYYPGTEIVDLRELVKTKS